MSPTINRRKSLAALAALAAGGSALAQGDKPIRILVGFPPGGAADTIARVLADKLPPLLKQPVIVESRPGVGGRLAAQAVKAAAPDGLTYMVAPNATFVFQHLTYPVSTLGYDMTRDFTSVARINSYPMAMVVNAGTGARNVKDYLAWRRTAAAQPTFGTAGLGGDTHFNGLVLGKVAKVEMSVVPYRGNGPLVTDLLGGQIMAGNMVAGDALQHVRAGKLHYLGVYAKKRSPLLPDVPTMAEQGFDTGGDEGWMGMWAPAGLGREPLERMQSALQFVLGLPEVKELMASRYLQLADYRPGSDVDKTLAAELAHWGPVIKASGFTPQQ
ncbi:MAG: ABC transporter substrate-binding protein [Burkholderiaceae bacterium]|nr:ABC transporter substrate-binding protein [Burkholderiaceae bacterium]